MSQLPLYPDAPVESFSLPGAELALTRKSELMLPVDEIFDTLQAETPWHQESITIYGKTHQQPRLLAWYGDPQATYSYSGNTYQPRPWTPLLEGLRGNMAALASAPFNSVLLNYYRDQHDSMGLHADDELELGPEPVIASLSLGEERVIYFRHKRDRSVKGLDISLPSGSVLLMRGATQDNWKHVIRKLSRRCGPRINLTFRHIQSQLAS